MCYGLDYQQGLIIWYEILKAFPIRYLGHHHDFSRFFMNTNLGKYYCNFYTVVKITHFIGKITMLTIFLKKVKHFFKKKVSKIYYNFFRKIICWKKLENVFFGTNWKFRPLCYGAQLGALHGMTSYLHDKP